MSPLHLAEAAAGAVILIAVSLLLFLFVRRHVIAAGRPMLLCALRTPTTPQWRLGLLRFGADRLDWFSVIGPSLRPERTWERAGMVLGSPAPAREAIPGLTDPIAAPDLERDSIHGPHQAVTPGRKPHFEIFETE